MKNITQDDPLAINFRRAVFACFHLPARAESLTRPLHIAPYTGAYGIAGYILCIEGSPPWGTVSFEPSVGRVVAWYGTSMMRANNRFARGTYRGNLYAATVEFLKSLDIEGL